MSDIAQITPQDVWQKLYPPGSFADDCGYEQVFPASLADGRQILLPIRPLSDGKHALASLIVNQASFAVVDALSDDLAERLAPAKPDIVVGLPTLGLTLASAVARKFGHDRYAPLGTSRKFWYDEALSVPLSSITTPGQEKRLYVDPRLLPLITGARVALIDDVISTGTSIAAALALLERCGVEPVAIGAAMLQSQRWQALLASYGLSGVHGCFSTPILTNGEDGRWHRP